MTDETTATLNPTYPDSRKDIYPAAGTIPPIVPSHIVGILLLSAMLGISLLCIASREWRPSTQYWIANLPAFLSGLIQPLLLYDFARRIFLSSRAGLYAAGIFITAVGGMNLSLMPDNTYPAPDLILVVASTAALYCFWRSMQQAVPSRWTSYGFASACALCLPETGIRSFIFPVGAVLLYLTITRSLARLRRMHLLSSSILFLIVAATSLSLDHRLLPSQIHYLFTRAVLFSGLYLASHHSEPIWFFLLIASVQLLPWTLFLFPAIRSMPLKDMLRRPLNDAGSYGIDDARFFLLSWAIFVFFFFCIFMWQEVSCLLVLPALTLLCAGWLDLESVSVMDSPLRAIGRNIMLVLLLLAIGCASATLYVVVHRHILTTEIFYLAAIVITGPLVSWLFRKCNRPHAGNIALSLAVVVWFIVISMLTRQDYAVRTGVLY